LLDDGPKHLVKIREHVRAGTLRSDVFLKEIYGSTELRALLWEMQRHKCCFCERQYETKWSTVEHFRPKTSANRGDGRVDIGYWWLCYEFSNLFFACPNCNTAKADFFPLAAGATPLAPEQHPNEHAEAALLIDPCRDDPEEHLTFTWIEAQRSYQIAPRTERGKLMIQAAQLDRDDLTTLRNEYYRQHLEPIVKRFQRARSRGEDAAASAAAKEARRFTQPGFPFVLLAKSTFRDAGMLVAARDPQAARENSESLIQRAPGPQDDGALSPSEGPA
jgi:uncharacterized protein (TIGR02646 family)